MDDLDRCDGTLTKVTEGKVLVRELHRKRSVLVRAGHAYLPDDTATTASAMARGS